MQFVQTKNSYYQYEIDYGKSEVKKFTQELFCDDSQTYLIQAEEMVACGLGRSKIFAVVIIRSGLGAAGVLCCLPSYHG